MEFWLFQNNDKLQLPVPPAEFQVAQGNLNNTIVVEGIGEVNILGKERLATITISSFFPAQEYEFCQYKVFPKPYECVELIEKFRKLGQVRLLITGTNINEIFYIEEFTYGEKDGTGDVYFTLQMKEFKKLAVASQIINNSVKRPVKPEYKKPQSPKKSPTYTTVTRNNVVKTVRSPSEEAKRNYGRMIQERVYRGLYD